MDNIMIERLWRSLKYEAVYLHELTDGFKADRVIDEWIDFYNTERPHSALAGRTPAEAYGGRAACGYGGQGSRLAHIPTGSTTATGCDKQGLGLIKHRNTP